MQTLINRKTRALLLASLLVTAAVCVQAVEIRGVRSCGYWISGKATVQGGANEAWLLGVLSGMALYSDKDILKGTDNESIYLWMDNYCRANPLKSISNGGDVLFEELLKQKKL